jgi:hypothetical protein
MQSKAAAWNRGRSNHTLHGEARFQACSSGECQRPNRVRLDLPIKAEKHVEWHSQLIRAGMAEGSRERVEGTHLHAAVSAWRSLSAALDPRCPAAR